MEKRWFIPRINHGLAKSLSQNASLSPILSRILINRKIETAEQAKAFLSPSLDDLLNPFLMNDIEKGADRIHEAIKMGERILIYGDYDVDGVTGTALLFSVLKNLGADVSFYIPHRLKEGYGLNTEAIKQFKIQDSKLRLIITVDCGTTSHKEIKLANSLGIDVIVTDHHQPQIKVQSSKLQVQSQKSQILPDAYTILNPKREDSSYPFRDLAGVGVVFKLCQVLQTVHSSQLRAHSLNKHLDLIALGTIADVVPLTGENRILIKAGLEILSCEERIGIKALKKIASLEGKPVNTGMVAFCLAPRINAAGRIGNAGLAVRLLLTDSESEAIEIAGILERLNHERQEIEEEMLFETLGMLGIDGQKSGAKRRGYHFKTADYSIILASPGWHAGVLGIVASRLAEIFYRPTFLFSIKDGIAKGSARSIPDFHLHEGLTECGELLRSFGGHSYAAGLSMDEENLDAFRKMMDEVIKNKLGDEDLIPRLRIDAKIELRDLNFNLINELDALAPYGLGNPEPVLGAKAVEILYPRRVGNNHLKMKVRQNRTVFDCIGFEMGNLLNDGGGIGEGIEEGGSVDIAFTPCINEWEGGKTLQLEIKAIRPHR